MPARAFVSKTRNLPPESRIVRILADAMQERLDDGSWWRHAFDEARGLGHRTRNRRSVEWFMNEQGLT